METCNMEGENYKPQTRSGLFRTSQLVRPEKNPTENTILKADHIVALCCYK